MVDKWNRLKSACAVALFAATTTVFLTFTSHAVVASLLAAGNAAERHKLTALPPPSADHALICVYRKGGHGSGPPATFFVNRDFLAVLHDKVEYASTEVPPGRVVITETDAVEIPPALSRSLQSSCDLNWLRLGAAQPADVARCERELREADAVISKTVTEIDSFRYEKRKLEGAYKGIITQPQKVQQLCDLRIDPNTTDYIDWGQVIDCRRAIREALNLLAFDPVSSRLGIAVLVPTPPASMRLLGPHALLRTEIEVESGRAYYVKWSATRSGIVFKPELTLVDPATVAREVSGAP